MIPRTCLSRPFQVGKLDLASIVAPLWLLSDSGVQSILLSKHVSETSSLSWRGLRVLGLGALELEQGIVHPKQLGWALLPWNMFRAAPSISKLKVVASDAKYQLPMVAKSTGKTCVCGDIRGGEVIDT